MFGLTKREQRWKAEQAAAELVAMVAVAGVKAIAEARIAEAQVDVSELARLRAENAELRAGSTVPDSADRVPLADARINKGTS